MCCSRFAMFLCRILQFFSLFKENQFRFFLNLHSHSLATFLFFPPRGGDDVLVFDQLALSAALHLDSSEIARSRADWLVGKSLRTVCSSASAEATFSESSASVLAKHAHRCCNGHVSARNVSTRLVVSRFSCDTVANCSRSAVALSSLSRTAAASLAKPSFLCLHCAAHDSLLAWRPATSLPAMRSC
jgi:hypothetical protein